MPQRATANQQPAGGAVAAVDPMSDPKLKKQVETARSVAYHLLKGIKMIGMYRHNEAKYGELCRYMPIILMPLSRW